MKPRAIIALALMLAFAGLGAWIWIGRDVAVPPEPAAATDAITVETVPTVSGDASRPAEKQPDVIFPTPTPQAPGRVASAVVPGMPMVRTTPTPQPPPRGAEAARPPSRKEPVIEGKAELEQVRTMLRDFRTRLGENPVGSNAEIMRAVMGGNEVRARLGPPDGQSLNEQGELLDSWGKPYFFHQVSKDSMEIRSAGPDGKMWTTDDLVTK